MYISIGYIYIYIYIYAYIASVEWGNLGYFRFSLISLKHNGLTVEAASIDCISPLPSEMSAAVSSAFSSWM